MFQDIEQAKATDLKTKDVDILLRRVHTVAHFGIRGTQSAENTSKGRLGILVC